MISFNVTGLEQMLHEVESWLEHPKKAMDRLDEVLDRAYKDSQSAVHVDTGNLKASGRKTYQRNPAEWEGEIVYGEGLSRPYAYYEMRRGGTHDFLQDTAEWEDWIETAALEGLGS